MFNQIHNEDCLETMGRLPTHSVDLVVTSPPYGTLRNYGHTYPMSKGLNLGAITYRLFRVMKQGGVVVWVVGDQTEDGSESCESFRQALAFVKAGFKLHDTMIYAKQPRPIDGSTNRYYQCFEYMFVFSNYIAPKTVNLIKDRPNIYGNTVNKSTTVRTVEGGLVEQKDYPIEPYSKRTNIWDYAIGHNHSASDKVAHKHPAIFPEKLVADHIESWSNEGDVVYDPFLGSGTTTYVAKLMNRSWIGSEINPDYFKVAQERMGNIELGLRL